MKKYVVFLLLLVFIPSSVKGIVSTDEPNSNHPITIYFFHREGCSHCEEEQEWLEEFVKSSSYIQVEKYEVTENKQLVGKVRKKFGIKNKYVPLTVIGDEYFIGYNKDIQEKIKKQCQEDIVREDYVDVVSKVKQEADLRNYSMISVPMLGIVLGLISGFNPFFLWTFAFFIMTLGRKKESKNTGVLGSLFLLGSGVLAMLGMLLWYGIGTVFSIPVFYVFIAMIALGLGILKISSVVRKKSGKKRSRLLVIRQMDRLGSKDVSLPDFLILILLVGGLLVIEQYGISLFYAQIVRMSFEKIGISLIMLASYVISFLIPPFLCYGKMLRKGKNIEFPKKFVPCMTVLDGCLLLVLGLFILFQPTWIIFPY